MAKKIIKVSDHYIKDNEEWFKNINFNDPIEVAHGFGEWLNLYFEVWAANHSTWMDNDNHAFTTEELLIEFVNEYKTVSDFQNTMENKLNLILDEFDQGNMCLNTLKAKLLLLFSVSNSIDYIETEAGKVPVKDMKEKILEIAEKLRLELITEHEAQNLLLGLFGVSGSNSNKCNECGKELESGTVFCSIDCRIHYYR